MSDFILIFWAHMLAKIMPKITSSEKVPPIVVKYARVDVDFGEHEHGVNVRLGRGSSGEADEVRGERKGDDARERQVERHERVESAQKAVGLRRAENGRVLTVFRCELEAKFSESTRLFFNFSSLIWPNFNIQQIIRKYRYI